jgi:hypothetical protein
MNPPASPAHTPNAHDASLPAHPVADAMVMPRDERIEALNRQFLGYLGPLAIGLLILFVSIALGGVLFWPSAVTGRLLVFDVITILTLVTGLALLALKRVSPVRVHTLGVFIVLAALSKNLAALYWMENPLLTINTMIILVGTSCLFLAWRPFLLVLAVTVSLWIPLAYRIAPPSQNPSIWIALFSAAMVSVLIFISRYRLQSGVIESNWRSERTRQKLSEALEAARVEIVEREAMQQQLNLALRHRQAMNELALSTRGILQLDALLPSIIARTRKILAAERCWLLLPCDPNPRVSRAVRRRRSRVSRRLSRLAPISPITPETAAHLPRRAPIAGAPSFSIRRDPAPAASNIGRQWQVMSSMMIAIRPASGPAWLMGVHYCRDPTSSRPSRRRSSRKFQAIPPPPSAAPSSISASSTPRSTTASSSPTSMSIIYEVDLEGNFTLVNPSHRTLLRPPRESN